MPQCIITDFTIQTSQSFEFDLELQDFSFDLQIDNEYSFDVCVDGLAISTSIFIIIKNKLSTVIEYILSKKINSIIKNKIDVVIDYSLNKKINSLIKNKITTSSNLTLNKKIGVSISNRLRIGKYTQLFSIDDNQLSLLDLKTLDEVASQFGSGVQMAMEKKIESLIKNKIETIVALELFVFFKLLTHDTKLLSEMDVITLGDLDRIAT